MPWTPLSLLSLLPERLRARYTKGSVMNNNQSTPVFCGRVFAIHRLRVNVKSLAAESRIIRQEMRRVAPAIDPVPVSSSGDLSGIQAKVLRTHQHAPEMVSLAELLDAISHSRMASRRSREARKRRRHKSPYLAGLNTHRRLHVREEARYAHLALGFLRGRKYREIENKITKAMPVSPKRLAKKISGFFNIINLEPIVVVWLSGGEPLDINVTS